MNVPKRGSIYTQRGGLRNEYGNCNLVIVINSNIEYSEIDFILYHQDVRLFVKESCFLLHKRLSTSTFSDIFKCGDIINPKYKTILKGFLEELANV